MNFLINSIGLGQTILLAHMVVFFLALIRWQKREIVWNAGPIFFDMLGFFSTLIFVPAFFALLLDSESSPVMSVGAAYLIYAFATLGVFVLITVLVAFWSGRFLGRLTQLWRIRKLGKNLGRPAD